MYTTYVDDVANISVGYGPGGQDAAVRCALFNHLIVVTRKFTLSPKSVVVTSGRKLAVRVARELSTYGIHVQVSNSTRDVGVMFTTGAHRDLIISNKRMAKAIKRASRIKRLANIIRAACKLYTSGAFPKLFGDIRSLGSFLHRLPL